MTNPPTMKALALSLLLAGACGDDSDGGSADGDSMTGSSGVSGTTDGQDSSSGGGGIDSQVGGASGGGDSAGSGAEAGTAAGAGSGGDGSAGSEAGAGAGASGAGGGAGNAPSGYPPDMPLDASLTSCSDSGQCVVVELGCCDACNGGLAVAVNRDSMADVTSRFSEQCDGPTICTLRGCAPWLATCLDGTCDLGQGMF